MNVKKIIAREGLILLGIAIILYIPPLFITINPPIPEFEAEFANGNTYIFYVIPKFDYSKNNTEYYMSYLKEWGANLLYRLSF